MKVIKLTESELNRIIKRVLQTEQESEEEPDTNLVVGLRNFSKGRISKDDLYRLDDSIDYIDVKEPLMLSGVYISTSLSPVPNICKLVGAPAWSVFVRNWFGSADCVVIFKPVLEPQNN